MRARDLRVPRRTRSGLRNRPWATIAHMLKLEGLGRWSAADLARAVASLPLGGHALAPAPRATQVRLEQSWREAWQHEFPDQPWPGLGEAQRHLRAKHMRG